MRIKWMTYAFLALSTMFALVMVLRGRSASQLLADIWMLLGPFFTLAFLALIAWGVLSLARIRRGEIEIGNAHAQMTIGLTRELGLFGTYLGLVILATRLPNLDLANPQAVIAGVMPGILIIALTTMVARAIAAGIDMPRRLLLLNLSHEDDGSTEPSERERRRSMQKSSRNPKQHTNPIPGIVTTWRDA